MASLETLTTIFFSVIFKRVMENQAILKEIKGLLTKNFPEKIEKVVLFGSRVSGREKKYSDYDVLVILKGEYDWRLKDKIIDLCYKVDLEYNILTDVKVISLEEVGSIKGKQPFIVHSLYCSFTQ